MAPGKRLTIGVTVNLERYENLRVAVEGDVNTLEDADDLARYLDDVLAGFGKNDPETKKQIANYRFRVLPGRGDAAGDAVDAADGAVPAEEELETDADTVIGEIGEAADVILHSDVQTGNEADAAVHTHSAPAEEINGFHCAECGKPISRQEDKLGRLFVDRPLCRACLETLQKAQQH